MYILILILSLKSQFNHNLDMNVIPMISTEAKCIDLKNRLIKDLKTLDPQLEVVAYCEKHSI